MKNSTQKGLSLIEALISTAIIGIGFIAIFQMVTFSVTSINTSGERTKANFMSSMVAEGFIGYKDSIGGLSEEDQENIYYVDGKAYIRLDLYRILRQILNALNLQNITCNFLLAICQNVLQPLYLRK